MLQMSPQHSPNKGGIRSAISQLIPNGAVVVELGDRIGLDSLEDKFQILTFYVQASLVNLLVFPVKKEVLRIPEEHFFLMFVG